MTLYEIRSLIISADPDAQHYYSSQTTRAYTRWAEYSMLPYTADDVHQEGWQFQVDRFATVEFDPVADAIRAALDADPRVSYHYEIAYEGNPGESGMIHHIFDCRGQ